MRALAAARGVMLKTRYEAVPVDLPMDGAPTYLFFVLVAPESSTGAHLKALARISRVFKDIEFRRRLLAAEGADAMYQVITDEDAKY